MAKLIKFVEQEISVPDDWNSRYYRTYEQDGRRLVNIWDENTTIMSDSISKSVDYEAVLLKEGKKEWRFYVNFEEAKLVMPFLQGIIANQTKKIRKENMELRWEEAELQAIIKRYRGFWFNRLWGYILGKIGK